MSCVARVYNSWISCNDSCGLLVYVDDLILRSIIGEDNGAFPGFGACVYLESDRVGCAIDTVDPSRVASCHWGSVLEILQGIVYNLISTGEVALDLVVRNCNSAIIIFLERLDSDVSSPVERHLVAIDADLLPTLSFAFDNDYAVYDFITRRVLVREILFEAVPDGAFRY